MKFWKKSTENLGQLNCYDTIDELPIKVWFDIHKTGLLLLLIKDNRKLKEKDYIKLDEVWEKIYDEFMTRFGLSDEFIAGLESEVRIAKLQAEYIITGQRHLLTLAKIEREELRMSRKKETSPVELEDVLAKMSKFYGMRLRASEFTTAEYYTYLKNIPTNGRTN
jgi:hypothetical protein